MADQLGNTRIANMIVFGAYMGYTSLMAKKTLYECLKTAIKHKRFVDVNVKAIDIGYQFGIDNRLK